MWILFGYQPALRHRSRRHWRNVLFLDKTRACASAGCLGVAGDDLAQPVDCRAGPHDCQLTLNPIGGWPVYRVAGAQTGKLAISHCQPFGHQLFRHLRDSLPHRNDTGASLYPHRSTSNSLLEVLR